MGDRQMLPKQTNKTETSSILKDKTRRRKKVQKN